MKYNFFTKNNNNLRSIIQNKYHHFINQKDKSNPNYLKVLDIFKYLNPKNLNKAKILEGYILLSSKDEIFPV